MFDSMRDRASQYLERRRNVDEPRALRRVRATDADLRVWRRDPVFREAERAAIAAPPIRARLINLADVSHGERREATPSEWDATREIAHRFGVSQ